MKMHFFLSIDAMNQNTTPCVALLAFEHLEEAEAHLRAWLMRSCGLDCYCGAEEEARLRAENGGELPEFTFACPEITDPKELSRYNGFYCYQTGGAFSLFVRSICTEEDAIAFKKSLSRAFELDKTFSDEADEMLEHLDRLTRSFQEDVDYTQALERLDALLKNGGLSLF